MDIYFSQNLSLFGLACGYLTLPDVAGVRMTCRDNFDAASELAAPLAWRDYVLRSGKAGACHICSSMRGPRALYQCVCGQIICGMDMFASCAGDEDVCGDCATRLQNS